MNQELQELISVIRESNNIVFFGGAGVSTESNIPDFRSADGLWNEKLKIALLLGQRFVFAHRCPSRSVFTYRGALRLILIALYGVWVMMWSHDKRHLKEQK